MKLNNLRIGVRFGLSFGILLVMMIGVNIFSISSLKSAASNTDKLYKHPFTVSTAGLRIESGILSIRRNILEVVLAKSDDSILKAAADINEQEKQVYAEFEIVYERFLGDKKDIESVRQLFSEWKPIRDEAIALKRSGKNEEASDIVRGKGADHVKNIQSGLTDFLTFASNKAIAFNQNAADTAQKAIVINYTVSLIVVVLSIIIAVFITRSITTPISKVIEVANIMSKGDMTKRLKMNQKDEGGKLADALDVMAEAMDTSLTQVYSITQELANASSELSDASESLSQGASEQASSLEEISSTMVEIDAQTRSSAENAANASKSALALKAMAENGMQEMDKMMTAMKEIDEAAKSIAKIMKVIDDIASQTNLLALNATIEAASAGDAGRGFAVVANEIKALANQSAKAAKETAELIEASIKKVERGTEITGQTSEALKKISLSSVQAAEMAEEIAASTNEQAQSIVQISQAVDQVDQVTQMNTANSEQTASSAMALSDQSVQLRDVLSKFKLSNQDHLSTSKKETKSPRKTAQKFDRHELAEKFKQKKQTFKTPPEKPAKNDFEDDDFEKY